jgi:hypothetical protein
MTEAKKDFTIALYYEYKKNYFKKFNEFYKNNLSHLNLTLLIGIKKSKYRKNIEENLKDYDFKYEIIKFTKENAHIKMQADMTYLHDEQQKLLLDYIIKDRKKVLVETPSYIYDGYTVRTFIDYNTNVKNYYLFGIKLPEENSDLFKPDKFYQNKNDDTKTKFHDYPIKITHSYQILLGCVNLNIENINECWVEKK